MVLFQNGFVPCFTRTLLAASGWTPPASTVIPADGWHPARSAARRWGGARAWCTPSRKVALGACARCRRCCPAQRTPSTAMGRQTSSKKRSGACLRRCLVGAQGCGVGGRPWRVVRALLTVCHPVVEAGGLLHRNWPTTAGSLSTTGRWHVLCRLWTQWSSKWMLRETV
jgi:hypothetical protein